MLECTIETILPTIISRITVGIMAALYKLIMAEKGIVWGEMTHCQGSINELSQWQLSASRFTILTAHNTFLLGQSNFHAHFS